MRCMIYSSNRLFGQCLGGGLTEQPEIVFAGACHDAVAIAPDVEAAGAAIVLVDLASAEGRAVVPRLARALPGVCVLGLSVDDQSAEAVVDCARLGCHAIVPQDAGLDDVVRIMQEALHGEVRIRPRVAASMMRALAASPVPAPEGDSAECLTRREREICTLICEGMTNKEIAREVNRSLGTVKNHVRSILAKFDVPRRSAVNGHMARSKRMPPQRRA